MASGEASEKRRPDTNMTPPPVTSDDVELLEHLLEVELDRLEVARQIEKDRETVFPETSVIVRDCLKLHDRLQDLRGSEQVEVEDAPEETAGRGNLKDIRDEILEV